MPPKLPPLSQPPTAYSVKATKIAAGMTYSGLTKTSTALPRLSSKRTIL
ncbi:branched-chain amino acid permease [Neisseria meningitidis]|uniref:Branched-chain amino acid permease n=1 Tax=Neisseria meningitidis TaxID=487 RepID=A0A425AL74_NEIME|nr:branched-chain amino acid permease [Neisseria meningitidis]MBG8579373.1 branched-chain amino acid permease [Neisseria meningitidis]MBG8594529.1 branched-chain amino acid permease [Neisseria meningitidis]MBG8602325.1 branched-chain amino acid permease [Neisseria meningitidis]MBG8605388.1 branched-chain amino acid permease [Neisseria meningitidis]MBG8609021.1 branched-chain amino acid permease [Neisseria meningitidis]